MARGGYRKPMNPAPVSGPGSLSQRTDGGPGDAQYVSGLSWGEGEKFYNTQVSGNDALRRIEQTNTPSMGLLNSASSQSNIPFGAPSVRPDEVITSGIDMGAGPDSSVLGYGNQESADKQKFASQMEEYRPALMFMAAQPNISPETRSLIRRLFV